MAMKVKEVAELVGVSVRTLHHYDAIGLLVPDEITDSGYRLYSEENLETLQHILFFKELEFPLKEIRTMMNSPSFNPKEVLTLQRKMLIEKRNQIDQMIETIDQTIKNTNGEIYLTKEERFAGINFDSNPYEEEARRRWGSKSVDNSNEKIAALSPHEKENISHMWDTIFKKLARLRDQSPASQKVQATIKEWYDFLNTHIHTYSLDAFQGLGQLYIQDERFMKNIDQYGEGLAIFMNEAMQIFANNETKGGSNEHNH